jgi:DNA-binding HxlR family transcriptional regulator
MSKTPLKIEYELTEKGYKLNKVLYELAQFSYEFHKNDIFSSGDEMDQETYTNFSKQLFKLS